MPDYRFPAPPNLDGDDLRAEYATAGVPVEGLLLDGPDLVVTSPAPQLRVARTLLAHRGRRSPAPRGLAERVADLERTVADLVARSGGGTTA